MEDKVSIKNELVIMAAEDIIKYLDEKYAIEVELYDIAELINLNVGFAINAATEFMKGESNGK